MIMFTILCPPDSRLSDSGLLTPDYGPWTQESRLRTLDCRLRTTDHGLRTIDHATS